MTRLLQIAHLGHPVLRERAQDVDRFDDREIVELIDDMIATTLEMDGVGLAAPQVYQSKRIIVVASRPNVRYPYAPLMEPTAIVNPVITYFSPQREKDWEGCLSAPGIRGLVPRSVAISLNYVARDGKSVAAGYEEFIARIIQHEVDHLDGISFLDRVETNKEIIMEQEFLKIIARRKSINR